MDLSIIIPIYNTEDYLEECLNSLLEQNYYNFEMILIDDGSTDKSSDICKKFLTKTNIFYIKVENKGCSEARNLGIKKAKGKYIIFIDSDDYIEKNILKELCKILKEKNLDLLWFGMNRINGNKKSKIKDNDYLDDRSPTFASVSNKIYKRELIEKNHILFNSEIHMGEDRIFNYKYFYYSNNILKIKENYYNYRDNPKSVTNILGLKRKKEIFKAFDDINIFYKSKEIYKKIELERFFRYCIKICYCSLEEAKINKKFVKEELNVLRSEINKRKQFRNKSYVYLYEIRLKLFFLKPILKKILQIKK